MSAIDRYYLFAGDTYYPGGGIGDLRGSFCNRGEAVKAAENGDYDWWHVLDRETMEVIADSDQDWDRTDRLDAQDE